MPWGLNGRFANTSKIDDYRSGILIMKMQIYGKTVVASGKRDIKFCFLRAKFVLIVFIF